jgi:hypothetical protein
VKPKEEDFVKHFGDVCHPDKHPNVSSALAERFREEACETLACWNIVRQYYHQQFPRLFDPAAAEVVHESYIEVMVLKIKDAATNDWKVARCFFDHVSLGRPVNAETEKLERVTIFV